MNFIVVGFALVIIIFFVLFESRRVAAEKVVLIAILSSLASVGRILFWSIPSVQPSSFIIIVTGIVFGGEIGFITGAITALTSNLVLGQGPWTMWQIFCWGMMGFFSAIFSKIAFEKFGLVCIVLYGFVWGFLFGWIMNFWFLFSSSASEFNIPVFIAACVASFPMDLAHALSNVILLILFGKKFVKSLSRISIKYGL